jgi:hypothetical protein
MSDNENDLFDLPDEGEAPDDYIGIRYRVRMDASAAGGPRGVMKQALRGPTEARSHADLYARHFARRTRGTVEPLPDDKGFRVHNYQSHTDFLVEEDGYLGDPNILPEEFSLGDQTEG